MHKGSQALFSDGCGRYAGDKKPDQPENVWNLKFVYI